MTVFLYQPIDDDVQDAIAAAWLEVDGRSLVDWHLEKLANAGFENVVLCVPNTTAERLRTLNRYGLTLEIIDNAHRQTQQRYLEKKLEKASSSNPLLMIRADIWTSYDVGRLPRCLTTEAHIVLTDNTEHHPGGEIGLQANGRAHLEAAMKLTFSGISLRTAPASDQPSLTRSATTHPPASLLNTCDHWLMNALRSGRVSAEYYSGPWTHIRHSSDLEIIDGVIEMT